MAAAASMRPNPEMLSATPFGFSRTALLTTRSRRVVRAASACSALPDDCSTHGAACAVSAAMAAGGGGGGDEPKNGDGNDPAPLTDTPSIAETSGFIRPSVVGPWLLKNSTVEFVVSLHDAFGLVENSADAAADAEQIAPTATTAAG